MSPPSVNFHNQSGGEWIKFDSNYDNLFVSSIITSFQEYLFLEFNKQDTQTKALYSYSVIGNMNNTLLSNVELNIYFYRVPEDDISPNNMLHIDIFFYNLSAFF